jgi:hypothetical protein
VRSYGRVPPHLWDGTIADLINEVPLPKRKDATLLVAYLLSSPRSHSCGLYEIPISTIARHTGLTFDEIRGLFGTFEEIGGLAYYDEEREAVFVPEAAAVEHPEGVKPEDNRWVSIKRHLETFSRSRLHARFLREHGKRFNLRKSQASDEAPSQETPEASTEAQRTEDKGTGDRSKEDKGKGAHGQRAGAVRRTAEVIRFGPGQGKKLSEATTEELIAYTRTMEEKVAGNDPKWHGSNVQARDACIREWERREPWRSVWKKVEALAKELKLGEATVFDAVKEATRRRSARDLVADDWPKIERMLTSVAAGLLSGEPPAPASGKR